jgi:hypothetical protein
MEFLLDLLVASRDKRVYVGSRSALENPAEWIAEKKARFGELYHEHPRLDSYPKNEPT